MGALAPVLLVYVPGGLGVHSPIPPTENDPGGHEMTALAPVPFVYVPAGLAVHPVILLAAEYDPAAH